MTYRANTETMPRPTLETNTGCPTGDPGCLIGFECEACIREMIEGEELARFDWSLGLTSTVEQLDELRTGGGSSAGGSSVDEVRWTKLDSGSWGIRARLEGTLVEGKVVTVVKSSGETSEVLCGPVSKVKGKGYCAPVGQPAAETGTESIRWAKLGDLWVVVTDEGHETGETVTVSKKSGETQDVTLGDLISTVDGRAHWTLAAAPAPQAKNETGETIDIGPGMYITDDGTVWKVSEARSSSNLYGRRVASDGTLEYVTGALRLIAAGNARRLTLEEAAAIGHATGRCCVCSRELSNPASIEAGIGPVCAGRL